MYCVKCGVKLQENMEACPLCDTPVWNPDGTGGKGRRVSSYPEKMPPRDKKSRRPALITLTVLVAFATVVETVICLLIYGSLNWSGYVTGGVILSYIIVLLPFWFERPRAELLVPADHLAAALFVFYVCEKTGGQWFFSFALPIIVGTCVISTVMICIFKYVKKRRLFTLGVFYIVLGAFIILIEFLESITFNNKMFRWSQFPFAGLAAIGILLLLIGTIRPLRSALEKFFFF